MDVVGASWRPTTLRPGKAMLADLFSCVGAGDVTTAKALLEAKTEVERVALLSATNPSGITLLQHACHNGQADGLSMLLDKGADPSWTSTKGSTPLHFACNAGHYDCALRLLRAGVNVNVGNSNGTTPLIIAAFGAHTECVRLLLQHGADPFVRDNLGRRAGDRLCGVVVGVPGVGGTGREGRGPFLETSALLAAARAGRQGEASRRISCRIASDPDGQCGDAEVDDKNVRSTSVMTDGTGSSISADQSEVATPTSAPAPPSPPSSTMLRLSSQVPSPRAVSIITPTTLTGSALQLQRPRRRGNPDIDAKAALAANAAMQRSLRAEEAAISTQRGFVGGNLAVGQRRAAAQAQATVLRSSAGAVSPEDSRDVRTFQTSDSPMTSGEETDVEDHGDACPSIERRSMGDAHRPRDRNGSNLRGHGSASKKHWSSVGQEFGVGNCPTCAERNECRSCRNGQPVMARLGGALSSEQEGDWTEAQNIRSKASSTAMDEVGDARVDVVGREARQVTGAPGQACDVADVLDAQSRRVRELEAELRTLRRDSRYRDGRFQRGGKMNANKRQRAGTSGAPATSGSSSVLGNQGVPLSSLSPREGPRRRVDGLGIGGSSEDLSPGEAITASMRNEVRRLRAEAAALNREHASLAAQHSSLVLEKARQAGALRHRVASANSELSRLSRLLREAREKVEVQARETEELRHRSEGQEDLIHSRSQDLQRALDRLESVSVALAQERSMHPSRRQSRDNRTSHSSDSSTTHASWSTPPTSPRTDHRPVHNMAGSISRSADVTSSPSSSPSLSPSPSASSVHASPRPTQPTQSPTMAVDSGDDVQGVHQAESADEVHGLDMRDEVGSEAQNERVREHDGRDVAAHEGNSPARSRVQEAEAEAPENSPEVTSVGGLGTIGTGGGVAGQRQAVIFSYQQIHAACQGFPDSGIVGRGGFGPVFRGRFEGEAVAVKRLDGFGLQGLPNFWKEVTVLTTCRHENLVPLLGICVHPNPMLVYPFVGHSLEWHLREPERRARLGWKTRLSIALSVTKGLQYLHQPQGGACGKPTIVHRDVKTENILLDANLRARLSDVGLAKQLDTTITGTSTRPIGTWGYIDPEYQETGVLTPSSDIFSLGVVFLELLTGSPAHSPELRPSSLVERVSGKQLGECLDSSCPWIETLVAALETLANEAWQCVKPRGDDRPRLAHVIARLERVISELRSDDTENTSGMTGSGDNSGTSDVGVDGTDAPHLREEPGISPGDNNSGNNNGNNRSIDSVSNDSTTNDATNGMAITNHGTDDSSNNGGDHADNDGSDHANNGPSSDHGNSDSGDHNSNIGGVQVISTGAVPRMRMPPGALVGPLVGLSSTAHLVSPLPAQGSLNPSPDSPAPASIEAVAQAAAAAAARALAAATRAAEAASEAARSAAEARAEATVAPSLASPAATASISTEASADVPSEAVATTSSEATGTSQVTTATAVSTSAAGVPAVTAIASPAPIVRDCIICASAPIQTRFLPCRHSLACLTCASLLRARGDRCPVDRAAIDGFETGQFQFTYPGN